MIVEVKSKFNIGDKVPWKAPYGIETVTITDVDFDGASFSYAVKGYRFALDESELGL